MNLSAQRFEHLSADPVQRSTLPFCLTRPAGRPRIADDHWKPGRQHWAERSYGSVSSAYGSVGVERQWSHSCEATGNAIAGLVPLLHHPRIALHHHCTILHRSWSAFRRRWCSGCTIFRASLSCTTACGSYAGASGLALRKATPGNRPCLVCSPPTLTW